MENAKIFLRSGGICRALLASLFTRIFWLFLGKHSLGLFRGYSGFCEKSGIFNKFSKNGKIWQLSGLLGLFMPRFGRFLNISFVKNTNGNIYPQFELTFLRFLRPLLPYFCIKNRKRYELNRAFWKPFFASFFSASFSCVRYFFVCDNAAENT